MLVVLGPVAGVSVVHLFAAAVVPGLILSGLYIAYTMIRCYLDPTLGPPLPPEERAASFGAIAREFFAGIAPVGFIIFAALGSILFGLATPTEGAAMATSGALLLTVLYRRLTPSALKDAALRTLQTSSMILFLAVASNIFGSVFSRLGTASMITDAMLSLTLPPTGIVVLLMAVIFLLGWPLEWPAIVLIFLPVIQKLGFNLVWFCTLVAVSLQTAFLSPSVAMAAYYLKGVAPRWDLLQIYRGMSEFMLLQLIGLAIVFLFPQVALWLPHLLFK